MSAVYGTLQGFRKSGVPRQKHAQTACGDSLVEAVVETWKTRAAVEVTADGRVEFRVIRSGQTIHSWSLKEAE